LNTKPPSRSSRPSRARGASSTKTTHPLRLFAGSANLPLAAAVAEALGTELGRCTTTRLPDTEVHVLLDDPVRDDDIFFIQPCPPPVNDNLMELLLYLDAFRRASAHSVTAVVPYFPYARQERMARGREAISAKVVAKMMESLGATRILYVDIHAPAIQGFFDIPVDPLSAVGVFGANLRARRELVAHAAVVAPDEGRVKLAGKYAEALGVPLVLMHKRRLAFDRTETTHVVGDIADKIPIVIDDIISGGSVLDQLDALMAAGARPEIHLAITHAVLAPSALERLDRPHIKELMVTDTVPLSPERMHPKVKVCSIAGMLAEVIDRIHRGHSIASHIRVP
jgi:ribose-phosphate pyrophosphokinase